MTHKIHRRSRLFPLNMKEYLTLATRPLLTSKGKIFARIVEDWASIVGDGYAPQLTPQRLIFPGPDAVKGTLYVQAPSHLAPEIPYLTPMLIEKLAQHVGYQAITTIRIESVAAKPAAPKPQRPAASAHATAIRALIQKLKA